MILEIFSVRNGHSIKFICLNCKKISRQKKSIFMAYKNKKRHFCSRECDNDFRRKISSENNKKCSKCGKTKESIFFRKNRSQCKKCCLIFHKEWKIKNKEKLIIKRLEYVNKNKEKINSITRKCWGINKEKYNKKRNKESLSLHDNYIKSLITLKLKIKSKEVSKDMIMTQRAVILFKRSIKLKQRGKI
jgi:hypothetical protein